MDVTRGPIKKLTDGHMHHAFTSCASWRDTWYVAYREAQSHHITPPGQITLQVSEDLEEWETDTVFMLQDGRGDVIGDLRDPKLVPSDEALYCVCGAYVPRYPNTTLSQYSSENLIQSYVTYTEDGITWAPLTPVGRPGYWIWSLSACQNGWLAAAYHTGASGEGSSIHLLMGTSPLELFMGETIYNGSSLTKDGPDFRFSHGTVSEPVLYQPQPGIIACCIRTEGGSETMEIGLSPSLKPDWRWWDTKKIIHPSAIIETPHGWLLAGRQLKKIRTPMGRTQWHSTTAVFHVDAQEVTPLLTVPSDFDTGYADLCEGPADNTFLLSYYSQHATGTRYGKPLPGAHVFVTTLTVAE